MIVDGWVDATDDINIAGSRDMKDEDAWRVACHGLYLQSTDLLTT